MKKIWFYFRQLLCTIIYDVLKIQMPQEKLEFFFQFLKFGFIGVLNNLIAYGIYIVLVDFGVHYTLANVAGFSISVFNSYYWNQKYVFKDTAGYRVWWKTFFKTYISYAGTGIVLSNVLLVVFVEMLHIPRIIAPIFELIVTVPVNFIVNKYWAYRSQ